MFTNMYIVSEIIFSQNGIDYYTKSKSHSLSIYYDMLRNGTTDISYCACHFPMRYCSHSRHYNTCTNMAWKRVPDPSGTDQIFASHPAWRGVDSTVQVVIQIGFRSGDPEVQITEEFWSRPIQRTVTWRRWEIYNFAALYPRERNPVTHWIGVWVHSYNNFLYEKPSLRHVT
jgi:hypothetical protein